MLKSTRNQLGNAKNSAQGDTKKVLCVCSAGLLRSPTMANVLHKEFGFNTRACGSCSDFALIPISQVLIHWADEVVFVNSDNLSDVGVEHLSSKKVLVLDIPDDFDWGDKELEFEILKQYKRSVAVGKL